MAEDQVTTNEIMDFLRENMVTHDELHVEIRSGLEGLKQELLGEMGKQKQELLGEMGKLKLDMLDSIDDKLADLKGDLVILMRREDKKVNESISLLCKKQVITKDEADRLMTLNPFPQSTT